MKRRIVCVLLSLLLFVPLLSGCGRSKGVNLAYPVLEDVRTFDPQYSSSSTALTVNANIFDCLVAQDKDGAVRPAAAAKWERNGAVYTFHLDKNVRWHVTNTVLTTHKDKLPADYAPALTANDFVFAFRRLASPQTGSPWAYMYDAIAGFSAARAGAAAPESIGVSAPAADTLTITLAHEDPDLLKKLAHPAAAPCCEDFFNICAGRYGLGMGYLLSNGPYYLGKWENETYFRIAQSPSYKGSRKPIADTVWFYLNKDAAKMNEKLADGVYAAGVTGTAAFDPDAVAGDLTVEEIDDVLYALIFNCEGELTSYATLRQALIGSVGAGIFREGSVGYFPKNVAAKLGAGVTEDLPPTESAETAKAFLQTALTETGQDAVQLEVLCAERHEDLLKQQMQHWQKELGVSVGVKIVPLADGDLEKAVKTGNYQAAYYPLQAKESEPADFLARFVTGAAGNVTNHASPAFDEAFALLSAAADPATEAAALNAALVALRNDGAYLPLNYDHTCLLRSSACAEMYYTDSTALMYFVKY